ncbi:MAG TPA: subtype I-B CRISPR-associated endonuclease Cas1, partial [Tepiditoga sp.]|nr:subtype I-B CRISPR-associated endonuclease Cas1 [Tepiditoga sp.]
NKGLFKKNHFKNINDGVYLNEAGKKLFISLYEERIDYTVEIKSMKRFMSYKMLMQFELSKIEHHLLGDKKYFPYVEGI